CRMCQDVDWRPSVTDDEGGLVLDGHLGLELAFHLDGTGPIPWREWEELLEHMSDYFGYLEFQKAVNLEGEIRSRATRAAGGPRIGYRRGPVQVSLTGGWSITIPGELAEAWETEGQSWNAWYGGGRVRCT